MKFFPVVHINDVEIAKRESEYALEEGVDGAYLIDHHNGADDISALFSVFNHLKSLDEESYVGINILGMSPLNTMRAIATALDERKLHFAPDGMWTDDIRSDTNPASAMEFKTIVPKLQSVRILGGVAFKYRPTYTEDPAEASMEAAELAYAVDVVTTSGAETGREPGVEKLKAMKDIIGEKPLAVASGISAGNIVKYAGSVDEVLAATSIETEKGSGVFNRGRLVELISLAHSLE